MVSCIGYRPNAASTLKPGRELFLLRVPNMLPGKIKRFEVTRSRCLRLGAKQIPGTWHIYLVRLIRRRFSYQSTNQCSRKTQYIHRTIIIIFIIIYFENSSGGIVKNLHWYYFSFRHNIGHPRVIALRKGSVNACAYTCVHLFPWVCPFAHLVGSHFTRESPHSDLLRLSDF